MSRPGLEESQLYEQTPCTFRRVCMCRIRAIVNIAALMDGEILILAQQCVFKRCLVRLTAQQTSRILSTSQGVAHNHQCQIILTTSQELTRNRAPPLPCVPEFLELKHPVMCWVVGTQPPTACRSLTAPLYVGDDWDHRCDDSQTGVMDHWNASSCVVSIGLHCVAACAWRRHRGRTGSGEQTNNTRRNKRKSEETTRKKRKSEKEEKGRKGKREDISSAQRELTLRHQSPRYPDQINTIVLGAVDLSLEPIMRIARMCLMMGTDARHIQN